MNKKQTLVTTLHLLLGLLLVTALIYSIICSIPFKQTITKIQQINVPQSQPVKINTFDVNLSYQGSRDDFEYYILDCHDLNSSNITIDNTSFNDNIDVPADYFNPDDDTTVNQLFTQPHYIGQEYYSNATHPEIKVIIKNFNIFGKQLKTTTNQHNIWPKNLHAGQHVNNEDFTTDTNKPVNNYSNTSYFTKPTKQQNTILHIEGHHKLGKYQHYWTGDYQISIDPQTKELNWKQSGNNDD